MAKHEYTIRLHTNNINQFNEVVNQEIRDSNLWDQYKVTPIETIYGEGELFLAPEVKTAPKWKATVEELVNFRVKVPMNTSSKGVLVLKKRYHQKEYFMSVSFGYGASILNKDCVVPDFGNKVVTTLLKENEISALRTTQISDVIIQSERSIIGDDMGMRRFGPNLSEFPRAIRGFYSQGTTEMDVLGSMDALTFKGDFELSNLSESLQFFLEKYFQPASNEWATKMQMITNRAEKDKLNQQMIENISNRGVVAIDWPDKVSGDYELKIINGLGRNHPLIENGRAENYFENLFEQHNDFNKILDKLKRDRIEMSDENNNRDKKSVYKCLITEVSEDDSIYILYNGHWYQVERNFYKYIEEIFNDVENSEITFLEAKEGEVEGSYNARLTANLDQAYELHTKTFKSQKLLPSRGSVEPADIVTKNKEFIFIKKGQSSAALSHLFAQGEVTAKLLAGDRDFRKQINAFTKPGFISDDIESRQEKIVFGIIRKNKNIPFFL